MHCVHGDNATFDVVGFSRGVWVIASPFIYSFAELNYVLIIEYSNASEWTRNSIRDEVVAYVTCVTAALFLTEEIKLSILMFHSNK